MEFDFNKISIGDTIQIILIIVFIAQTFYLARQTNFGRRSSQANLTETWIKEFQTVNTSLLSTKNSHVPDEAEFVKLINILDRMHLLLRQKLLKPSDFADIFLKLYDLTSDIAFRKTVSYMENYLKLQNIFHEFNKDMDVIMIYFNTLPPSGYKEVFNEQKGILRVAEPVQEWYLRHWIFFQILLKTFTFINVKIRRSQFFELEEPMK